MKRPSQRSRSVLVSVKLNIPAFFSSTTYCTPAQLLPTPFKRDRCIQNNATKRRTEHYHYTSLYIAGNAYSSWASGIWNTPSRSFVGMLLPFYAAPMSSLQAESAKYNVCHLRQWHPLRRRTPQPTILRVPRGAIQTLAGPRQYGCSPSQSSSDCHFFSRMICSLVTFVFIISDVFLSCSSENNYSFQWCCTDALRATSTTDRQIT